ncbi:MAG: hypothetical protein MR606_02065 [Mollicutes bacterium]|nr:hypothetical protein [Mollicutes bacterium]MDD7264471.1 hypothetical protein [bacterium]MDY4979531.1 hypothetical protein [Candidatus Onthovivens sp.]
MNRIEILIIVLACIIVCSIIGYYIYRKIKRLPISDCGECASKGKNLVKAYNKKYKKNCNCKKN